MIRPGDDPRTYGEPDDFDRHDLDKYRKKKGRSHKL